VNWPSPIIRRPVRWPPIARSRSRHIVFLTEAQVEAQLAVLAGDPSMRMAATILIHAGLRRAETLWLTREAIAPDLSYLSVRNRRDEDSASESFLKTGERTAPPEFGAKRGGLVFATVECFFVTLPDKAAQPKHF